jgi:hypothetical protein
LAPGAREAAHVAHAVPRSEAPQLAQNCPLPAVPQAGQVVVLVDWDVIRAN